MLDRVERRGDHRFRLGPISASRDGEHSNTDTKTTPLLSAQINSDSSRLKIRACDGCWWNCSEFLPALD